MQEIRIGQGLGGAVDETAAAATAAGEKFAASAEATMDKVADATASTLREAGRKGAEIGKQVMDTQDQWMSQARDCVRQHPLTSVAVALGVGMLLRWLRAD